MSPAEKYISIRRRTEELCAPLQTEDYVVQPIVDVSPPKWHLGHSSWFFETFLLKQHLAGYKEFDPGYNYVFNSYYETIGARVIRTDRGNLSRPTVNDIYRYRKYVDNAMTELLQQDPTPYVSLLELGLNHEQQHQELLLTDIKYILGHNPLFPAYNNDFSESVPVFNGNNFIKVPSGLYWIGHSGNDFCFDNELGRHQVYLSEFQIAQTCSTNKEYMEFIDDGGYTDFRHWHSEGWDWVKINKITAPMYWYKNNGEWMCYTMSGMKPVEPDQPVCHISYYEACAFASWQNKRLPTEFEWEAASSQLNHGTRWEWTESAYLPYPGYSKAGGAIGEYNGKFMVNQMVLRGGSIATAPEHFRTSYRNFFHPYLRWQFTGIRLCNKI